MNTLKVGITGGIGAGKSVISSIFKCLGYPVFNSDAAAKQLMQSDPELIKGITEIFGENAYTNGLLNRSFISEQVFKDNNKINQLNQLVHPKVRSAFNSFAQRVDSDFVFNEAAILFETEAYKNFDKIILVTADKPVRIERVKQRDNASEQEILSRMAKQISDEEKRKFSPFEIVNNTQLLTPQVLDFIENHSTSS